MLFADCSLCGRVASALSADMHGSPLELPSFEQHGMESCGEACRNSCDIEYRIRFQVCSHGPQPQGRRFGCGCDKVLQQAGCCGLQLNGRQVVWWDWDTRLVQLQPQVAADALQLNVTGALWVLGGLRCVVHQKGKTSV